MNQFLQDFLCDDKRNPDKGLQWYLSLAQKYKLKDSEEYILGFFGTVYGKVEIQEGKEFIDASGAKVQITDKPNNLKTTASDKGNYEIAKAPLHCKCPPYPISAEHEGDRVDSEYVGKLDKPTPDSRQKKDLLITGSAYEWNGRLTFEASLRFICTHQTGYPIEENKFKEQIVDLKFSVEQISFQGMSPIAKIGGIDGSGTIKITLDNQEEEIRTDYYRLEKWNAMNTFPISGKNLVMTIQKKMKEDPETLKKRLEELAKTDPTKLIQEMQLMNTAEDKRHFEVDIYILINGDWLSDVTRLLKVDSKDKNTHDITTEAQKIGIPMALRLTGDMSLDPDGAANITASSYGTEYLPNGTIADFGCPPITSLVKFEMQLHKRKK
jgi:hypothetical protein